MATLSLDEAMSAINGYLDKVAASAESYMKGYIKTHADNPTGKLEGSINVRRISESARGVGSDLHYAKFADEGRGPVHPVNKKALKWEYPRPNGDIFIRASAGPAEGLHFIDKTAEFIEGEHISLT